MNKMLENTIKKNIRDFEEDEDNDSLNDLYSYNSNEDNSSVIYDDIDNNSIWTNIERDLDEFIENLLQ